MSSTQHQLIEQCATRLRGIVEALDNIHDNTPHRWSTDLDDVHSSAESLLALIKDQAPARSEASFEEWLANELEGEDGQPVPAAVCDIALARRAFNHWPKLEQPAKVGGVRFSAGVSSRLVVEAAQRLNEFESTPEKEAERIERLQAFREQLDPLNLAPHAEAFNEAPADALRPEQAEAERPEVAEVAFVLRNIGAMDAEDIDGDNVDLRFEDAEGRDTGCDVSIVEYAEKAADLFEQHDRIVGALRAENAKLSEALDRWPLIRDSLKLRLADALARVAELEKLSRAHDPLRIGLSAMLGSFKTATNPEQEGTLRMARQLLDATADARYGDFKNKAIVDRLIAGLRTPVAQAQQLHDLDKQCRDDVARALGLRPNQERGFAWSYLLASIKSCVKASEDSAQAQHSVPRAWLDVQAERRRSTTTSTARRDLVKACALALAEIERLDRATATQGGPRDA
ncbi:TPA: hypothetical protein ACRNJV_001269 [Pseudomonas aeruginosa]|nr:hypothetical protein [Pseudomonas aeruginosa]